MLSDYSMINWKYIQYSRIFHTFPENNRTGYLPEKLMPFLLADGAGFFRQCQIWNIVVSNANVLDFHMQSSFWLVLLLYRKRNVSSNVQSPRFCDRQNRGHRLSM